MQRSTYYKYGRQLLEEKNECLHEYLLKEKQINESVYNKVISLEVNDGVKKRLEQLQADRKCIEYALSFYEQCQERRDVMTKTLIQLAQEEAIKTNKIITAIKVEGKLKELSDTVVEEGNIEFITTETKIGIETYRRSVIMLMLSAIHNMYPKDNKLKVYVQYSVSKGVYCEIQGDFEVTQEFLDNLKVKMLAYVAKVI